MPIHPFARVPPRCAGFAVDTRFKEFAIIGHSMGGLVARSACHHGLAAGPTWPKVLRKLVFLGTPHHGSPLERGGHGLVPLDSALGQHRDAERTLAIPKHRQWVGFKMGHRELLNHPDVYSQLHTWLKQPA